jgi:hypothetical protein
MSGGAALAKPLKQFKQTWKKTFPEEYKAADDLVDASELFPPQIFFSFFFLLWTATRPLLHLLYLGCRV